MRLTVSVRLDVLLVSRFFVLTVHVAQIYLSTIVNTC